MNHIDTETAAVRAIMRVELDAAEAVDLFTVLNIERDRRFDDARCPADIKDALGFHQLVARFQAAYIKAGVAGE